MDVFEFIISLVAMILAAITFWMILYSKGRSRSDHKIDPQVEYDMRELSAMAESMKERIDVLESILDAEIPDWREQNDHGNK
jgi:phage shock protein B